MLKTRTYGSNGTTVVLLHGGPGAPGYVAPIARALADTFRVLEPFQRGSGSEALTVARHVLDLHEVIAEHCPGERPALVGSSWGAMLALAFAAAHPQQAGPIVLIGCGAFTPSSRILLQETLASRMDSAMSDRLEQVSAAAASDNERLVGLRKLLLPLYAWDPITTDLEYADCDALAYEQSLRDMYRLQNQGVYPAAFASIQSPVLMLHGSYDPYPGAEIYESLRPHLPLTEYRELENCGHYPWIERGVREEFFGTLKAWLLRHQTTATPR
jgi:pimeloyl-ACP methyl ester carboxylesterase